jgi:formylglycine-generating enzyme required for sulfatase activity
MMKARLWLLVVMVAGALTLHSWGQASVITRFQPGGQLSWSNRPDGVVEYRVQGADSLAPAVWTNEQVGIVSTGSMMSVLVPVAPSNRFYRLTAVTNLNVTSDSYLVVDLSGGPSASSYPVSYLSTVPDGGWTDEYKTTNMVFRRIPAGTFTMGSPTNELGRESAWGDETHHQVTLMQPFYVGVFEVTQRQWERVMGTWPGYFNNVSYRDARPVERVSYNMIRGGNAGTNWPANANVDADSFMGRLRARTGKTFDLPTESQWEYAGRAGTTTALNSGKNLTNVETCPNMFEVGRYWYSGGSGYSQNGDTSGGTAKAGTYLPNAWGLYDIHGNVWEWCLDWYPGYEGSYRVFRGGSWNYGASYCRVAHRGATSAGDAYDIMGFRAAMPSGQ